jgi:peptidoglycan/xylan/chitin deacetylase (PgdA/CDA1 family)
VAATDRRHFLIAAAAATSAAILPRVSAAAAVSGAAESRPEIAFTFDDSKTAQGGHRSWQEVNERILAALANHKVKSVLFVCGMRVDSAAGHDLVGAWDRGGHLIANHSYSHFNLDEVTLAEFQADVLKNEPLITSYPHFTRLFRYPMFKEGNTVDKRDGMRSFLKERAYRIGRATVDASDWAISARLESRLEHNATADVSGYRDFFLQHIWERTQYYHSLARQVVGRRPVRHTVLLHHNVLNALFLDDLVSLFVSKGWRPIDAEYAYADPVYDRQPQCLPAGESLIWGLAKETGRFESQLRYPGEDDVYENPKMDTLRL